MLSIAHCDPPAGLKAVRLRTFSSTMIQYLIFGVLWACNMAACKLRPHGLDFKARTKRVFALQREHRTRKRDLPITLKESKG